MKSSASLENLLQALVSFTETTSQQAVISASHQNAAISPQVSWITKGKYCDLTGLSEGRVRHHIQRSWVRGQHYQIRGKTTMINIQETELWWQQESQQESIRTMAKSVSGSTRKGGVIQKPSTAITTTKLTLPPQLDAEKKFSPD